jgi:hypothetical protein
MDKVLLRLFQAPGQVLESPKEMPIFLMPWGSLSPFCDALTFLDKNDREISVNEYNLVNENTIIYRRRRWSLWINAELSARTLVENHMDLAEDMRLGCPRDLTLMRKALKSTNMPIDLCRLCAEFLLSAFFPSRRLDEEFKWKTSKIKDFTRKRKI